MLEAALLYLEKAKELDDWENKLVDTAKNYEVYEGYYHSAHDELSWDTNQFHTAGFYTDRSCLANIPSPFHMASAEEWFYLFWARRVQDGNLESAKSILQLVINYMNEID